MRSSAGERGDYGEQRIFIACFTFNKMCFLLGRDLLPRYRPVTLGKQRRGQHCCRRRTAERVIAAIYTILTVIGVLRFSNWGKSSIRIGNFPIRASQTDGVPDA
jgi:hypothetical protein